MRSPRVQQKLIEPRLTYTKFVYILNIYSAHKAYKLNILGVTFMQEAMIMSSQLDIPARNLLQIFPPGSGCHLIDRKAVVTTAIHPDQTGRVKFLGTWWPALCEQAFVLLPGTTVYVVDRENLTLVVEPALPVKPAHN